MPSQSLTSFTIAASAPCAVRSASIGAICCVLPNDENEHIAVKRATLQRGLQPLSIIDAETDVYRHTKPYRGWLNCRERPNVVIEAPGILFRM